MKTMKLIPLVITVFAVGLSACQKNEEVLQLKDTKINQVSEAVPGQYIVVFSDDVSPNTRQKIALNYQQKLSQTRQAVIALQQDILGTELQNEHVYYMGFFGFASPLNSAQIEKLGQDPRVERIVQDKYIALAPPPGKGKPGGGDGGNGGTEAQQLPWGVQHVNGGVAAPEGSVAWIIDTGIDLDHPDLNVNTDLTASFIKNGDGNDRNGHGTHVAGTLAAIDNSTGVVGVAAGAEVVSVQVLNHRGVGTLSDIIAGVQYVGSNADNNDVANMSLGGSVDQTLDNAVIAASQACPFVLAAGNENDDASNYSPGRIGSSYSNIYTIGAAHNTYNLAFWPDSLSQFTMIRLGSSNFGNSVDYYQPGTDITSCYKDGGYETLSGTSMAAPHMSGLVLIGYTVVPDSICYDGNDAAVSTIYEIGKIPVHQ